MGKGYSWGNTGGYTAKKGGTQQYYTNSNYTYGTGKNDWRKWVKY